MNILQDLTLERAHRLESYKNRIRLEALRKFRNEVVVEGADLPTIEDTVAGALASITGDIADELFGLSGVEASWQAKALAKALPFSARISIPTPKDLRRLVSALKIEGSYIQTWMKKIETSALRGVKGALRRGLAESKQTPEIVRDIREVLARPRREIEAVVLTAAQQVSAETRLATIEENSDLCKGWQFLATLDGRTTLICMANDGRFFPNGSGNPPPLHWRCRSQIIPVLKSWKAMGQNVPEGSRASMDGQVPEKVNYNEWLRGRSEKFQNEVLGPRRAELFRGGLDVDGFVNREGRTLTLKELGDE